MANKLYQEESVQDIAEALRLKNDGSTDTYTISAMDDAILKMPFGNVPSYHYTEAGRVVKRLLELKALYPHNIVFGTISDNHVDKNTASTMTSARHASFALESVGSMACDFVANLGDNISGNSGIDADTDYANAFYMENATRYAIVSLESFNLIGNHDKSNSTQKLFDLIGKYNNFDSYGTTQIRGFGYKDFDDKKVRVICLNTTDYWNIIGGNGMSYEQKDFFMRWLDLSGKANFEEWTIIILSHIPLDFLGGDYNKGSDLKAILKAYNDGTTATITVNSSYAGAENESNLYSGTLSYNYSGKNAPAIINIHGHIHTNKYGKLKFIDDNTELNIMRVATPNSSFNGNASTDRYTNYGDYSITAEEANKIKKVANSKADTSATFYFIDLDGQTIYAIGYGADIDRTVIYKVATKYSVTYNLTDVTSSNTASEAVEGSSFTATFSVGTDFALDTVTVKMGGVDITSSAYSNGVINIANVTGNIVITATAKDAYVPHWDIGDRTAVTNMYETKAETKAFDRTKYYYGAARSGMVDYRYITSCTVSGNDVTFTGTTKNTGIGLPFHLEAGASYTFSAKASAKGRIGMVVFNADGTYTNGASQYSSNSYTAPSITFTAPTDSSMWVMLIVECYTVNSSITYSDIKLTKN